MTQTNLFAEQLDVNPNPKIQVVEKYILTALNNFSTIFLFLKLPSTNLIFFVSV